MRTPLLLPVLAAAFLSFGPVVSFAQDTSKKQMLAGELLDLLNMQKTFDATFDQMPKMQEQMLASQKTSPAQQEKFNKQMQQSMQAAKEALSWDSIKPIFVKIYADNFDEPELEGIIAYYKSPVGQKWIEKQPQVQAATMQAMSQLMPKIQAAILKATKQPDKAPAAAAGTP